MKDYYQKLAEELAPPPLTEEEWRNRRQESRQFTDNVKFLKT